MNVEEDVMKSMRKIIAGVGVLFFAVTLLMFTACPTTESDAETFVRMTPGTYTAKAEGFDTSFDVWVTVSETVITNIDYDKDQENETSYLGGAAIPVVIGRILTAQTVMVDGISGATITSTGLKNAVRETLLEAGAPSAFTGVPVTPEKKEKTLDLVTFPPYGPPDGPPVKGVLVIGSGVAGLSAAIEARQAGANVTIIEKQDFIGGSSITSAGIIYAPVDASDISAFKAYYKMRAQEYADDTLLDYFANNALDTLAFVEGSSWLAMPTGTAVEARGRMNFGLNGPESGVGLVRFLESKAKNLGVTILTGVKATELIPNSDGAIVGAKAESKTHTYTINASAVVIATGGFDSDRGSDSLLAQHNPEAQYDFPRSSWGNTGDGIHMGIKVGAATVFKGGMIGWGRTDATINDDIMIGLNIISDKGDLLDLTPPAADSTHTPPLTAVTYANTPDYPPMYSGFLKARRAGATKFWVLTRAAPAGPSAKFASTADTVEALAGLIGVDATKLQTAFDNATVAPDPEGPPEPYTATQVKPSSIGSMGGLKVNVNAQVLKPDNTAIPGLYAAGETANGDFYYLEYPASGSSLSLSITFGRVAGQKAGVF
jgi:fumarate reductase flavoprotein subunit